VNKVDHDYMRVENMRIVFECIRKGIAITKRDIQKHTGLSWGTVSGAINELLSKGIIVYEEADDSALIGRPPKYYDVNNEDNFIIGVDINVESLRVVVIDLKYNVIYSDCSMVLNPEKEYMLENTKKAISKAIENVSKKAKILGIGFAVMSAVDTVSGIALYSQHIKNWKDINLKQIFEEEFGLPVIVEHDPNCLAVAEMSVGKACDYKNVLFLRMAMGIGMSIVINGEVYRGSNSNAGEFGHLCYEFNGAPCTCGKRGCIESYASITGIANRYRENLKKQAVIQNIESSNYDDDLAIIFKLARAAMDGDESAKMYFDTAAKCLGWGIGTIISLLNPDVVVLGGILMEYSQLFLEKTKAIAKEVAWAYSPVRIIESELGRDAGAIGAAARLIQTDVLLTIFN